MKRYHYFVSYQYTKDMSSGFGQLNLLLKEELSKINQLQDITSFIKKEYSYEVVIILNFILLQEESFFTE